MLILVVEDNELVRETVQENLVDGGFAVLVAATGQGAFDTLETNYSDLRAIIVDVHLDGTVSGWDVANRARDLNKRMPIIYVTGAAAHDWTSRGVPNSLLLTKPFDNAQLRTAILQLVAATDSV